MTPSRTDERWERVRRLRRARPRSRLVRLSGQVLVVLVAFAWLGGDVHVGDLLSERRLENLERFLTRDALPYPIREHGYSWQRLVDWASAVFEARGREAMLATFWLSVVSITLAGLVGALAAPFATRTLATAEPYRMFAEEASGRGGSTGRALAWRLLRDLVRAAFVLMRAIPEYVMAFLLLAVFGPSGWPVVLALAIHNAGILGRLGTESLENLDRAPMGALRMAGATRTQIAWTALRPLALGRFLSYVFYRYETCVREATVLGMLGVVSLGYWIQDARARQRYDEMLLLVGMGALLVLAGDLLSYVARHLLRKA